MTLLYSDARSYEGETVVVVVVVVISVLFGFVFVATATWQKDKGGATAQRKISARIRQAHGKILGQTTYLPRRPRPRCHPRRHPSADSARNTIGAAKIGKRYYRIRLGVAFNHL